MLRIHEPPLWEPTVYQLPVKCPRGDEGSVKILVQNNRFTKFPKFLKNSRLLQSNEARLNLIRRLLSVNNRTVAVVLLRIHHDNCSRYFQRLEKVPMVKFNKIYFLRTFAPKSSHAHIFSKLSPQIESDEIRLKT